MGIYAFKLPDIGEGVVEGEVVEWMVAVGDTVAEDQPILSVMTDKATVENPPRPSTASSSSALGTSVTSCPSEQCASNSKWTAKVTPPPAKMLHRHLRQNPRRHLRLPQRPRRPLLP